VLWCPWCASMVNAVTTCVATLSDNRGKCGSVTQTQTTKYWWRSRLPNRAIHRNSQRVPAFPRNCLDIKGPSPTGWARYYFLSPPWRTGAEPLPFSQSRCQHSGRVARKRHGASLPGWLGDGCRAALGRELRRTRPACLRRKPRTCPGTRVMQRTRKRRRRLIARCDKLAPRPIPNCDRRPAVGRSSHRSNVYPSWNLPRRGEFSAAARLPGLVGVSVFK
jgi:hypothetical protein